ncbi:MAG: Phosphatase NudJ [Chlamydiae bacterium]|nr:Phosphatase NudJ [Chlamydiota bacterium]
MNKIEIYEKPPQDFTIQVEVVAVYFTVGNEALFLQRSGSERGTWGVPAGKLEKDEILVAGIKRELYEETSIIASEDHFLSCGQLYIRKPHVEYIYHMFSMDLSSKPVVKLSEEHLDYGWFSSEKVEQLPLMTGALEAFRFFKNFLGA